jgi:transposase InsO family protein
MSREAHVRFCESVAVRSRRATRPVTESFFHTLKVELVHQERYVTRRLGQSSIFEYIETYYNWQRKHAAIGHRIPMLLEKVA